MCNILAFSAKVRTDGWTDGRGGGQTPGSGAVSLNVPVATLSPPAGYPGADGKRVLLLGGVTFGVDAKKKQCLKKGA